MHAGAAGWRVMGSKKLKAVVVKGSQKPEISDEKRFEKARTEALQLIKAGSRGLSTYGHQHFKSYELPENPAHREFQEK